MANKFYLTKEMRRVVSSKKGIHIVIPKRILDISQPIVVSTFENRILFALNHKEFIYVRATDTDYGDDPDTVFADQQDLNYLLMQINNIFPTAVIQKKNIISV